MFGISSQGSEALQSRDGFVVCVTRYWGVGDVSCGKEFWCISMHEREMEAAVRNQPSKDLV